MARQRVVMTRTGRFLLTFLVLAVAGYLLPLAQFQSAHDFLEISIHGAATGGGESVRQTPPASPAHDCHSCLANHPGASVFPAPEGASFAVPRSNRHLAVPFVNSIAFRSVDSPNKRSPPLRFA